MKEELTTKDVLRIIGIVIGVIGFVALICWSVASLIKVISKIPPPQESAYSICLRENADRILKEVKQCIKDAQGNNVRCENTIKRIICP